MIILELITIGIVLMSMIAIIVVAWGKQAMKHEQRLKLRREYDNSRNN